MKRLLPATFAALALSLGACSDPSEAYTPVDELPSAQQPADTADAVNPPTTDPAPADPLPPPTDPSPTDPVPEGMPVPTDPEVPPPTDPLTPPVDEATRPPPVDPAMEDEQPTTPGS